MSPSRRRKRKALGSSPPSSRDRRKKLRTPATSEPPPSSYLSSKPTAFSRRRTARMSVPGKRSTSSDADDKDEESTEEEREDGESSGEGSEGEDRESHEEEIEEKGKKLSIAPIRIKKEKSGEYVIKRAETDSFSKPLHNDEDESNVKKVTKKRQKTEQKKLKKNMEKAERDKTGQKKHKKKMDKSEGDRTGQSKRKKKRKEKEVEEFKESSEDESDSGSGSSSESESLKIVKDKKSNVIKLDDAMPEYRDNSSDKAVMHFKILSGRSSFLTETDCQEFLEQPFALISSDTLLWLMTSVGSDKFDPNKHYLYSHIHMVSTYMGLEDVSSRRFFQTRSTTVNALFKAEIAYIPVHSGNHFSLVVVEGLPRFLSRVQRDIYITVPSKVMIASHYDSLAIASPHKMPIVRKMIAFLVKDALQSIGHSCSVSEVFQHLKLTRVTKKKDQPSGHVTCGPFVALYFKEHLNNISPTTSSDTRRKRLMDLLNSHKETVRLRYNEKLEKNKEQKNSSKVLETDWEDSSEAPDNKREDSSDSPKTKKKSLGYSQDVVIMDSPQLSDEDFDISTNYYRLELRSVLRSQSAADILQLCNHWIDECFWNACGKDKERIPIREESDKKELKKEFKSMYAENLKKGARIPKARMDSVLWLSMGAMLMVVDNCFLLPGGAAAEKVFIAMRTYPQSEVWSRAFPLLFVAGTCAKISFQEDGLPAKGFPLQKYLRLLFGLYQGQLKSYRRPFTPRSMAILQEISVHVVAILEYVLQCSDVAALDPSGSDSAAQKDLAIAEELKGIELVEREHLPHRNAGRFIENSKVVSEEPFSGPTFKRMKTALNVAVKVMNASKVRLLELNKNTRGVRGRKEQRSPVPSQFVLREFARPVFSETLFAVEKHLQSVMGCEVGTETLNRIKALFGFANVCLAASHGLDTPGDISLDSLRKPDFKPSEKKEDKEALEKKEGKGALEKKEEKEGAEKKEDKDVPEEPKEVQHESKEVSKEVKLERSQSRASTFGFSLQFADPSNTFMRYHENFSPVQMIYIPSVLQLISCALRLRHHKSTCRKDCLRHNIILLSKTFGSFLRWGSHGWTGFRMLDVDRFRIERLRDSVVLGSMEIMGSSNHPCMKEIRYPSKSKYGTINIAFVGHTTASNSGATFSWAGLVLDVREKRVAYQAWTNSSTIAYADICFPYFTNKKYALCDLVSLEFSYELQWDFNSKRVPADANGKPVDFMEMDFVSVSFIDKTAKGTESHFGIVSSQPRLDKHLEERRRWVSVTMLNDSNPDTSRLTDSISKWRGDQKNDVIIALRKLEPEGIRQPSRLFEEIWKRFYKMDSQKLLGFADPPSLARSFSQRFWDMVSVVQCRLVQENATMSRGTRDTAGVPNEPLSVGICKVAECILSSARNSVSDVVRTMGMTVNDSQLRFLVSWASHVTAYHHSPDRVQRWMSDRSESLGSGRNIERNISSSMFFCQGPPGTGKSHIATILLHATTRKHFGVLKFKGDDGAIQRRSCITNDLTGRVLILTVTNAAVDDLLLKYFRATENDLDSMFAPFRLGSMSTENAVKQFEAFQVCKSEKLDITSVMNQKRAIFSTIGAALAFDWKENVRPFDLIVIDEAAYASEPELTAVLARVIGNISEPKLGTSVVFVGDQAQLPPFDDKTFPAWTNHRKRNLHFFSRAMSLMSKEPSFPEEKKQEHVAMWEQTARIIMQLQTQMRSAPPIGEYVSHHFYEGKVQNGPRPTHRYWVTSHCMKTIHSSRFPLRVVNFIDTKQCFCADAKNSEVSDLRGGYNNPFEIYVITQMLQEWKSASLEKRMSIGVLTPYISQKNAIKKALEKVGIRDVAVLTFASAQGKEFDVVLISLVRTYVESESGREHFSTLSFLNDKNSACVAMSRAREVLIIVGKLRNITLGSALWRRYLTSHRSFPQDENSKFRDFLHLEPIIELTKGRENVKLVPQKKTFVLN